MTAKRNPLPRQDRRHLDRATAAEYAHADINHRKPTPGCWYCLHEAGEHLDHDFIVAGCPDCAENLAYHAWLAKLGSKRL